MTFSWEMLTTASPLEGARLDIEHVPATVSCHGCGAVTTLDIPVFACSESAGRATSSCDPETS